MTFPDRPIAPGRHGTAELVVNGQEMSCWIWQQCPGFGRQCPEPGQRGRSWPPRLPPAGYLVEAGPVAFAGEPW